MSEKPVVMVVDDDAMVRGICRQFLEIAGFQVLEAEDGNRAKAIFPPDGVSLLVSDVVMPGMSGPALANDLLSHHPEMKVLYVSGTSPDDEVLKRHVRDLGCGFLAKPFAPTELLARVRQLLNPEGTPQTSYRGPRDRSALRVSRRRAPAASLMTRRWCALQDFESLPQ
jgi:two-component system cell cycle sensor histidine kinase/response regulator CckA